MDSALGLAMLVTVAVVAVIDLVWVGLALGALLRKLGGNPVQAWIPVVRWMAAAREGRVPVVPVAVARSLELVGAVLAYAALVMALVSDASTAAARVMLLVGLLMWVIGGLTGWVMWIYGAGTIELRMRAPRAMTWLSAIAPVIWASVLGWGSYQATGRGVTANAAAAGARPVIGREPVEDGVVPSPPSSEVSSEDASRDGTSLHHAAAEAAPPAHVEPISAPSPAADDRADSEARASKSSTPPWVTGDAGVTVAQRWAGFGSDDPELSPRDGSGGTWAPAASEGADARAGSPDPASPSNGFYVRSAESGAPASPPSVGSEPGGADDSAGSVASAPSEDSAPYRPPAAEGSMWAPTDGDAAPAQTEFRVAPLPPGWLGARPDGTGADAADQVAADQGEEGDARGSFEPSPSPHVASAAGPGGDVRSDAADDEPQGSVSPPASMTPAQPASAVSAPPVTSASPPSAPSPAPAASSAASGSDAFAAAEAPPALPPSAASPYVSRLSPYLREPSSDRTGPESADPAWSQPATSTPSAADADASAEEPAAQASADEPAPITPPPGLATFSSEAPAAPEAAHTPEEPVAPPALDLPPATVEPSSPSSPDEDATRATSTLAPLPPEVPGGASAVEAASSEPQPAPSLPTSATPPASPPEETSEAEAPQADPQNSDAAPTAGDADEDHTVITSRRREAWALQVEGGASYGLGGDNVVLGRSTSATIPGRLGVDDPTRTLSKLHAELEPRDGGWWVRDLGSTNGTYVRSADGTEREVGPDGAMVDGDLLLGDLVARIVPVEERA